MKKQAKVKFASALASAMMIAASLTSCVASSSSSSGFKMMAPTNYTLGNGKNWGNKQFFQKMHELTGVDINFDMVYDQDTYGQKKNTIWIGGDESIIPDFFYKALLSRTNELSWGEEGDLIPLDGYLEECCPNLIQRMSENPMIRKAITCCDGHIYALPTIHTSSANGATADGYYFINKKWCEEVGVDPSTITTIEKLRDTLVLFKNAGKTYPMYVSGQTELLYLFGTFGYNIVSWNAYVDDDMKVHVAAQEEKFKDMMRFFRDMNLTRGLFNDHFELESGSTNKRYHLKRNEVGCFMDYAPEIAGDYATDFVALPAMNSSQYYTGTAFYPGRLGVDSGAFAITRKCTDPKTLLRWVDNVYNIETSRWDDIGVEGIDWKFDDETKNTWSFLGDRDTIAAEKCVQYGGGIPGVEMSYDGFYTKCSDQKISHSFTEVAKAQAQTTFRNGVPQMSLSTVQMKSIRNASNILSEHIANYILKSITDSSYNIDTEWASLQTTLNRANVDGYIEILQAGVDSFYA